MRIIRCSLAVYMHICSSITKAYLACLIVYNTTLHRNTQNMTGLLAIALHASPTVGTVTLVAHTLQPTLKGGEGQQPCATARLIVCDFVSVVQRGDTVKMRYVRVPSKGVILKASAQGRSRAQGHGIFACQMRLSATQWV